MSIFSESRRQIANRGGRKIQNFTAHTQKSNSSQFMHALGSSRGKGEGRWTYQAFRRERAAICAVNGPPSSLESRPSPP